MYTLGYNLRVSLITLNTNSFHNFQARDTRHVHKLTNININNCLENPCVEKFSLPTVRFSVSCRPNMYTLGYNLRVSLITCSRYFMS